MSGVSQPVTQRCGPVSGKASDSRTGWSGAPVAAEKEKYKTKTSDLTFPRRPVLILDKIFAGEWNKTGMEIYNKERI
jgi:hypothetical protein